MPPPLITLLTDFGVRDYYVAAMKAVLLRSLPEANLVDVTHEVPPQDVLAGSFTLERAVASFPPGTVHLAVVDPGVGTDRRLLGVSVHDQLVVCPDNGLITWTHRMFPPASFRQILWRPESPSHTFHGRDVLAPVAARLAGGEPFESLGPAVADPVLLDVYPATGPTGQVLHIDHFGNATTSIPAAIARGAADVLVNDTCVGPLRRTYADVPPGQPLALIGSSDLLEIAVHRGSAARLLSVKVGDAVHLRTR
jgi:S-adenosylmethionine hydrolase